jgi:hypothetical protein
VTLRIIIDILALLCVVICGMLSTIASWEMVEMANLRLPKMISSTRFTGISSRRVGSTASTGGYIRQDAFTGNSGCAGP